MNATPLIPGDPDVEDGIYYPSSDGKPMAETDFHVVAIRYLLDALEDALAARPGVYVSGNTNWFWAEGEPKKRRSPDAMVVFGVERKRRRSFRSWREGGVVPAVCFEMASARTWRANLGKVKDDYEANGVREYFVYDPTDEYLPEGPLMGFRRRGSKFHAIRPDAAGGMVSRQLGLRLVPEGLILRCVHADTAEVVLTREEQAAAERAKAEVLAAEVARLKAMLRATGRSTNGAH